MISLHKILLETLNRVRPDKPLVINMIYHDSSDEARRRGMSMELDSKRTSRYSTNYSADRNRFNDLFYLFQSFCISPKTLTILCNCRNDRIKSIFIRLESFSRCDLDDFRALKRNLRFLQQCVEIFTRNMKYVDRST